MKLSLNWIKKYVPLPDDMDMAQLAYDLTMSTVEVEGTEDLSKRFDNMVVGVITEVLPHPNADALKICKTDIGGEIKEIVCGGINVREGLHVLVALPGAIVRWHGQGDPVEIAKAAIRHAQQHGNEFVVRGVFTYEGKKGTRPCVITDGFNINLPGFFLADVNSIMNTPEECEAINNGKCGFTITTYIDNKYGNGTCYSGKFHEIK